MHKSLFLILTITLSVHGYAWADASNSKSHRNITKTKKCLFPKSKKRAPAWICNGKDSKYEVTAVGYFAKSRAGDAYMKEMAAADARTKLANEIHRKVTENISTHEQRSVRNTTAPDKALIKKITQSSLQGTHIVKSAYAPDGSLYVLLGIKQADTQNLYDKIAADYVNQH